MRIGGQGRLANDPPVWAVESTVGWLSSQHEIHPGEAMPSAALIHRLIAFAALSNLVAVPAEAQRGGAPAGQDYTIHNFRFESGETLPELRMHYITLGKPRRDAGGVVRNAVSCCTAPTGRAAGS